jgi:hypothetical protein
MTGVVCVYRREHFITANSHRTYLGPISSGRLHSRVAFLFLLFMCADIAFPPPCARASERSAVNSAPLVEVLAVSNSAPVNECRSSPSPEETCRDEDCCFGCAHLLPAVALSDLGFFDAQTVSPFFVNRQVLSPPLQGPYHPPRFA